MEILVLTVLWLVFCIFSLGVSALIFVSMKKAAKRPWQIKMDENYKPRVSILVPTYNEEEIIRFKLENLVKVNYPKALTQIIVVDSNSQDQTVKIVKDFIASNPENNIQILVEEERKGKSAALNFALKNCKGDVVIVSDADCFWPSDILEKALPFLADPSIGAVSGPKVLLNPDQTWVTRTESAYLHSMNMVRVGESKVSSTLLFEGGFSAYKRELLDSFDPYNTGSDDCGTVVALAEKGYKTICVPEAHFYSAFPTSWREKIDIKMRRANQLVRVLWVYLVLLLNGRLKVSKRVIVQGIWIYLVSPVMFIGLIAITAYFLFKFPYSSLVFVFFLTPNLRFYIFELIQNYLILFVSIVAVLINIKFMIWRKPKDRPLLCEDILRKYELI